MPKTDYSLLFEDGVYEDMARDHYNSSRWMSMQPVPMEAVKIHRSDKKFVELCRRVLLIGDVLTMRKAGRDGIVINFSATVGKQFSVGASNANLGLCSLTDQSFRLILVPHYGDNRPS